MWRCCVLLLLAAASGKLDSDVEEDNAETGESDEAAWGKLENNNDYRDFSDTGNDGPEGTTERGGDGDLQESSERLGATVTQITKHPYAASLHFNDQYVCSAIILNAYWLVTETKCFDTHLISSYITHRNLANYTVRVGSTYNSKGGSLYKITALINNFDMKATAMKLTVPLEFGSRVQAAKLPAYDEDVALGYLASMIAWTPIGHMRIVSAPIIEPSICEAYTKLLPGHFICVGGVQDLNRKFCRKDNGGAVIQNNTLIGMSSFLHSCAIYTRTHAFPKVSTFARWLDSVIWDENNRPSSTIATTTHTASTVPNVTENPEQERSPYFGDPRKFMLTLPFDPINVPLEPAGDNSVIPRMSLYESYLRNIARAKTSTTVDPKEVDEQKRNLQLEWMKKYRKGQMLPPQINPGKLYNSVYQ